MSFAAIICASHVTSAAASASANESASTSGGISGDAVLRAGLHFAGHSLVEYQARQAAEAGAADVLILIGAVTQPLSRAVDRLAADGIAVTLVRDMVTLVREAPRDRDMLLIADGAIIGQRHYEAIAQIPGNVVLVADDSRASAGLERVDGQHRWAGLARVAPDLLFGTLDMLGDWDLELTLMRAAVQAGAVRITVPQDDIMEGRVAIVDGQATADLVAQALLGGTDDTASEEGGAEHYLLSRVAARLAPMLLRTQVPIVQVRIGGMAVAAFGVIATVLDWPVVGLLLMLMSLIVSLTADRLAQLARRGAQNDWIALTPPCIVLLGIALAGGEAGQQLDGLYLAGLVGILTLGVRWGHIHLARPWALFTPGSAVLLMLVSILLSGVALGLVLSIFCAIGSLAWVVLARKDTEN